MTNEKYVRAYYYLGGVIAGWITSPLLYALYTFLKTAIKFLEKKI